MSEPYREPYQFEKKKESKMLKMLTKLGDFLLHPVSIAFGVLTLFLCIMAVIVNSANHSMESEQMRIAHETFVRNQEICQAAAAWYVHDEDYHGLISCHRLDNHEQFYVVPDTGLVLFQTPRICSETVTIRIER